MTEKHNGNIAETFDGDGQSDLSGVIEADPKRSIIKQDVSQFSLFEMMYICSMYA